LKIDTNNISNGIIYINQNKIYFEQTLILQLPGKRALLLSLTIEQAISQKTPLLDKCRLHLSQLPKYN